MLFGETVAVYCENQTEHVHAMCAHNKESYGMLKRVEHVATALVCRLNTIPHFEDRFKYYRPRE
jgi:hypothetical protein